MTINNTTTPHAASVLAASTVVAAEPLDDCESAGGEADDVVELPVIRLTDLDEEMGVLEDPFLKEQATVAVAESIVTSMRDADVTGGFSTRNVNYDDTRAEFVSVTFFKDHPGIPLGINLKRNQVRIGSLTEGSIARDSPLRPGDKVLSVNNKDCTSSKMNSSTVVRVMKESRGDVTIVVHNEGGAPDLVESMIMKSDPNEKVGISVKQTGNSGTLLIGRINEGSKFAHSLLHDGDTVLAINGTAASHLEPIAASNLIRNSPKRVTILARTQQETGAVLAELSDRFLVANSSIPVLTGTSPNNAPNNRTTNATTSNNNRPATNTTHDAGKQRARIGFLCMFAIVTIVVVAVVVSKINITKDETTYSDTSEDYWKCYSPGTCVSCVSEGCHWSDYCSQDCWFGQQCASPVIDTDAATICDEYGDNLDQDDILNNHDGLDNSNFDDLLKCISPATCVSCVSQGCHWTGFICSHDCEFFQQCASLVTGTDAGTICEEYDADNNNFDDLLTNTTDNVFNDP